MRVAYAGVRSKVVVLLLFIHCFFVPHIVGGDSVFVFVLLCITLCPFWFCNHPDGEERAGCFALIVFLMSCEC